MTHPLDGFAAPEPLLVLVDDTDPAALGLATGLGEVVALSSVDGPVKRGQKSVLLVTADRGSLRRLASALPRLGQARVVATWLHATQAPLVVVPRPEWPALTSAMSRTAGRGVLTVLRFADPLPAHQVLGETARQAAAGFPGHGGLVVSYAGRPAVPGLDARAALVDSPEQAADQERDVPPDVVLVLSAGIVRDDPMAGRAESPSGRPELSRHPVTDRAPLVVTDPGLDPVDELVVNPRGWRKDWTEPVADVATLGLDAGVREGDLPRLRELQGVRVRLGETPAATVVGLAASGVPLLATGEEPRIARPLREALAARPDLDDSLAREEHSVAVRRAALDHHSTLAWRADLAARAGVRFVARPRVSILLATMRPHQLDFALRQVGRQDPDAELVLATHGFAADPAMVRDALGGRPVVLLDFPADTFFGDVLHGAAIAAGGDVLLKFDDDDWYSPHVVHDLLLARRFSGAEVVGMPSEFVYLEELGVTAQRNHPTEVFNRFVAGGTIMVDRDVLHAVGGFRRVRQFVDAQLLDAVQAAGGRIFRTHGLGYVLRRTGSGHTWQSDPESFRRPEILARQWTGFHASRELLVDPRDLP